MSLYATHSAPLDTLWDAPWEPLGTLRGHRLGIAPGTLPGLMYRLSPTKAQSLPGVGRCGLHDRPRKAQSPTARCEVQKSEA
jgi:hypothetical protein